jgi:hypothetical protein
MLTNYLPPCSKLQLEKLTVAQLSINVLPFMKQELHCTFRKRSPIHHTCARQIRAIFSQSIPLTLPSQLRINPANDLFRSGLQTKIL